MHKLKTKFFLILMTSLFCQIAATEVATTSASASAAPAETGFSFTNTRSIHLRDENLKNPQVIAKNANISIDPEFLKLHLGRENPGIEKIQQLLLNPTEASKDIVTEAAMRTTGRGAFSDYFFPVLIKGTNGEIKKGKMALQAYHRNGQMEIKMADGSEPKWDTSDPDRKRQYEILKELNSLSTEAGSTTTCTNCQSNSSAFEVQQIAGAIEHSAKNAQGSLYQKYQDFAREFLKQNGSATRRSAAVHKRRFVASLIQKFGDQEAALILAALTGFGEAPTRKKATDQIAEIASVLKVIDNRARVQFRKRSRTLKDIGVSANLNPLLTNILADSQFSVWNDYDNNLTRILNYNPDKADPESNRRMTLAFEAQEMMAHKEIEFIGKMNFDNLYHYHANYTTPNWADRRKRVEAPIVRIKQTHPNGQQQSVDVHLPAPKQNGTRHIFYAGVP